MYCKKNLQKSITKLTLSSNVKMKWTWLSTAHYFGRLTIFCAPHRDCPNGKWVFFFLILGYCFKQASYRVVLILTLQVVLYELDVVYGLFQLKRIFLPYGCRHVVERVVYGRYSHVNQAAGCGRGRRPVAPGPTGGCYESSEGIGWRTVPGRRWRRDRSCWGHV